MADAFITATSSEGLQALGSAAQRSWELITGTLRDRLSPEAAAMFAEPVAARHGGMTEWYTSGQGTPVALRDLPPAEAERLRAELARVVGQVTALADGLAAQATEESFWLAEALRNALQVPDEGAVWALRAPDGGLAPMLVNWGRVPDDNRAVRGVLSALTPRAQAPRPAPAAPLAAAAAAGTAAAAAAAPAPVARARAGAGLAWLLVLGWVALAAMIGFALWLLIAPCGLRPGLAGPCRPEAISAAAANADGLGAEIAVLQAALADRELACLVDQRRAAFFGAPPRAEAPVEAAIADLDRRLAERGAGQGGALTFSLVWSGRDDLDISLRCPSGSEIDWRRRGNDCGGTLDVDANYPLASAVDDPVENVTFPALIPGRYSIKVRRPADRAPAGPQSFAVVVRQDGKPDQRFEGQMSQTTPQWVQEIEITP
jgi:hypothetical protein